MSQRNKLLRDLEIDCSTKPLPTRIEVNKTSILLRHCSASIDIEELSSWFVRQVIFPKIYFYTCHTGKSEVALGSLYTTEQFPEITICENPYSLDPKLYGVNGALPSSNQFSVWKKFPSSLFILPQVLVRKIGGSAQIHLWFTFSSSNLSRLRDIVSTFQSVASAPREWAPKVKTRRDLPTKEDWSKKIERSLEYISTGKIEKIVLARQSSFTFLSRVSVEALIAHLQKSKYGLLFSYQISSDESFIGLTPEVLYNKEGANIEIMALAGTAFLGKAGHLWRSKEEREFSIVKDFIYSRMQDLCKTICWTPDIIRPVSTLLHWSRTYRGTLRSSICDREIIKRLHPTPAISGFPQKESSDLITKIEPFFRGWYASPIGYVSSQKTELHIAIRSALVQENRLHIFSGAGIVSDSIANLEWEELDHKMNHFF